MITDEKIKEIRKRVNAGFPEGEIKEDLMREGYSKEEIAKVFAPHEYDMRSWYFVFGVMLLFVGIWLYASRENVLGLIFSALLFMQYHRENVRLKNRKKAN